MIEAAKVLHARRPDLRFLVACLRPEHAHIVEAQLRDRSLPLEVHAGRTAEICVHTAHSVIAKSGSVSLELLYHGKPAVVVYQLPRIESTAARWIVQCPYISLVNLLAGKRLFPEYLRSRLPAEEIAGHVLHWLDDPAAYREVRRELAELRERVAEPGACDRAAQVVLETLSGKREVKRGRVNDESLHLPGWELHRTAPPVQEGRNGTPPQATGQ